MKKVLLITAALSSAVAMNAQNPLQIPDTLSGNTINLNLQTGTVNFFTGTPTNTMGANGSLLGPTLLLDQGQQVTINITNQLGEETTIHWHGMHVSPENDGGPHTVIPDGNTWSPSFMVRDWASTFWYHPHLHMMTNTHVQKGIAGFIIVRDSTEAALTLPRTYGVDDFPLAIQTKAFDANNQVVVMSALDTAVMINGTLDAYLDAPAQVVRMRLLNGSSERVYNIGFAGNKTFHQIGSDGGLLSAPIALTRLMLAPGERAEILIDLAPYQGQSFDLMSFGSELGSGSYGAAQPGMGPGQQIPNYTSNPLNGSDFSLMTLNVVAPTANPVTAIPASLVTHAPWTASQSDITRTLTFTPVNMGPTAIEGPFLINNAAYDMNVINYTIPFENIEIWDLQNQTPISHPFHIHDVQFYILDVNGVAPSPSLSGRKDVVLVPPMGSVRFITKFENFYNDTLPYMYHCHMLTHEDDGMMGQFVVASPLSVNEAHPANDISIYPNPSGGLITIRAESSIGSTYTITDAIGKLVMGGKITNKLTAIDMSSMAEGLYFLKVEGNEKQALKIVKR